MLTLSVSFVACMLSYSIFWSQTSNKLTYLLTYLHTWKAHMESHHGRGVRYYESLSAYRT